MMEAINRLEENAEKSVSVYSALTMIDKIAKPKNKIIERLKMQMKSASSIDPVAGYSRMHSRHNRS